MKGTLVQTIQLGLRSLLLQKMRTSLAALGIFIGTSTVIWLVAMGEGVSYRAQQQIKELRARPVVLRCDLPIPRKRLYHCADLSACRADALSRVRTLAGHRRRRSDVLRVPGYIASSRFEAGRPAARPRVDLEPPALRDGLVHRGAPVAHSQSPIDYARSSTSSRSRDRGRC